MNSDMKTRFVRTPKTPSHSKESNNETLQVFCRLRPIANEQSCVKIESDTTVELTVPDTSVNSRPGVCVKHAFSFRKVFSDQCGQKEVFDEVALPLVEKLIKGGNGLLLTYGVTGSGKTYTMTGVRNNLGIMPRCVDVLFNSIDNYQANQFVFKSDRMNSFDVQTRAAAAKDYEDSLKKLRKGGRVRKNQSVEDLLCDRSNDGFRIPNVNPDHAYSVFVNYIEIYNENVYDLLDNINESDICTKSDSKFIRDDCRQNGYAIGVTEIEVKSANEALEIFCQGKRRKRVAQTALNNESSRSHSIFTIRLVQAPLDERGEEVEQCNELVQVSQLSLVDLAGSERSSRTNNSGERARETGSINNSLMILRTCLENLRDRQQNSAKRPQIIPFRHSKLTRLFRNFFEGRGNIRMIVCVNPRKVDYDETIQVMKFAETSQEIVLKLTSIKPTPIKTTLRKKAHLRREDMLKTIEELAEQSSESGVFSNTENTSYLFKPFPQLENNDLLDGDFYKNLKLHLENRKKGKENMKAQLNQTAHLFRNRLVEHQKKLILCTRDFESNGQLQNDLTKNEFLNEKLTTMAAELDYWKRKYRDDKRENKRFKREVDCRENKMEQMNMENDQRHSDMKNNVSQGETKTTEKKLHYMKFGKGNDEANIPTIIVSEIKQQTESISEQCLTSPNKLAPVEKNNDCGSTKSSSNGDQCYGSFSSLKCCLGRRESYSNATRQSFNAVVKPISNTDTQLNDEGIKMDQPLDEDVEMTSQSTSRFVTPNLSPNEQNTGEFYHTVVSTV